MSFAGMTQ